jgi:mannose-6-phosphate isomerase-like protein (cupin superfamily)
MKYAYSPINTINKFGVDITLYDADAPSGIVYEEVEVGHMQEWYDDVSTYQWYIIEGSGTFVLNDAKYRVKARDLVVVPPKTHIHYFGKMKMVLVTTPKFEAANEHEVRLIGQDEVPV